MDNIINISQLNDFIFCPYSIYLHNVYNAVDDNQFHYLPQTKGKQAHATVDNESYSTKADIITAMMVYNEKYALMGKIDQYFADKQLLVERKRTIKTIYDGYKLQLYAQYFCMIEMGFTITALKFHSLTDNRNYDLPIPNQAITLWFEDYLQKIRNYNPAMALTNINSNKCKYCIYRNLCDQTDYID